MIQCDLISFPVILTIKCAKYCSVQSLCTSPSGHEPLVSQLYQLEFCNIMEKIRFKIIKTNLRLS